MSMSITSVSELDSWLELSLISFSGSDSTLTWQGGDKRNRRRQEGWGGGWRLFEGGDYFKYFRLKGGNLVPRAFPSKMNGWAIF